MVEGSAVVLLVLAASFGALFFGFMIGRLVGQRRYLGEIIRLREEACRRRLLARLGVLE